MPFIYLVGLLLLAILCLHGLTGIAGDAEPKPMPVTRNAIGAMSQSQVESSLRKLENQPTPAPKMGAMCYEPIAFPATADYLCPTCGEKTLYSKESRAFVGVELDMCRRQFADLKKATTLSLALDESSFCAKCSPNSAKHQLALVVKYPDGSRHVCAPVTAEDLRMLEAFLKGETSYRTFNEGSEPLKPQLPRLRELLGTKPDNAKGK